MEQYGLIGLKLGHSFSLNYFNEKFKNENIDAVYVNYEISNIEDIFEIIASNPDLKGLNVTIPYKEQIIPYLDEVTPEATTIGAVNVVKITHQGSKTILKGFNSDVVGFTQSIEPLLERDCQSLAANCTAILTRIDRRHRRDVRLLFQLFRHIARQ